MKSSTTAVATRRLKLLKPVVYAREELEAGRLVVVDADTGARWVRDGIAVDTTDAMARWPTCPRCGATWSIPEHPTPAQRWVQCPNPHCCHGWLP